MLGYCIVWLQIGEDWSVVDGSGLDWSGLKWIKVDQFELGPISLIGCSDIGLYRSRLEWIRVD